MLKWDTRREEKGKHGKFDFLWKGPYVIYGYRGNNALFIKYLDGKDTQEGPVNGRMLKHYYSSELTNSYSQLLLHNFKYPLKFLDWIGYFLYKVEAQREGPKICRVKCHKYEFFYA